MTVRFISALAWIFFITTFFTILVSYANFPNEVLVSVNASGEPLAYLGKDLIFYLVVAFLIVFNMSLRLLKGMLAKGNDTIELTLIGVSLSQLFTNMFLATAVYFINILNSRENFNYSNFGYLIYVTGTLLAGAILFTLVARFILKK
jgi:uncharacterized membrane protein